MGGRGCAGRGTSAGRMAAWVGGAWVCGAGYDQTQVDGEENEGLDAGVEGWGADPPAT